LNASLNPMRLNSLFLSLLWQRPTVRRPSIITRLIRPTSRQTIRTTRMKKKEV
jgi:hypothetical protein